MNHSEEQLKEFYTWYYDQSQLDPEVSPQRISKKNSEVSQKDQYQFLHQLHQLLHHHPLFLHPPHHYHFFFHPLFFLLL